MDPRHILTMMEDLETLDPRLVEKLQKTENGCLLGPERLAKLDKRVGERFKLTSINYKGIDLDFEIIGALPEGRYGLSGIMNAKYFNDSLDKYARDNGKKHALDEKRLNLIWLRVPDRATFDKVGHIIESGNGGEKSMRLSSGAVFANVPVKVETASGLIGNFLDAYRDLLLGVKYLLVPAILAIMSLVVANAISISVRERRTEMAVLKVLGYSPAQILALVLGEAMLVGSSAGLITSAMTWIIVNFVFGGINFQIGFFPAFMVPVHAFFWGLAMGAGTSLLGSFWPAWTARQVKVSEVFSKVA
jgi:putative ABC transport system permease protein